MIESQLRAFEALEKSERLADLKAVVEVLLTEAAATQRQEWRDAARLKMLVEARKLEPKDGETPYGNALSVLERGPEDDAERALACALAAHGLLGRPEERAEALLWLGAHTPFDATPLIDRACVDATGLFKAIAALVARVDRFEEPNFGRAEAFVGAAALALSRSDAARSAAEELGSLRDPALRALLGGGDAERAATFVGELGPAPRGVVATVLLAVSGLMFIGYAFRLFGRLALGLRRPADVSVSAKQLRVRWKTVLLGRTIAERETVIGRDALVRATREVRFPRLGLYVGLYTLAAGSYFGISTFVDGVRAASPSLLLVGLALVAVGVGLELLFTNLLPASTGRCRVLFVPRRGNVVCVNAVDTTKADAALGALRGGLAR